jgi:hypothetical protein
VSYLRDVALMPVTGKKLSWTESIYTRCGRIADLLEVPLRSQMAQTERQATSAPQRSEMERLRKAMELIFGDHDTRLKQLEAAQKENAHTRQVLLNLSSRLAAFANDATLKK